MPKRVLPWLLDVAGVGLLTVAAWQASPIAGLAVLGLGCLGMSLTLDPSKGRRK